jgi:hypothetical protein
VDVKYKADEKDPEIERHCLMHSHKHSFTRPERRVLMEEAENQINATKAKGMGQRDG